MRYNEHDFVHNGRWYSWLPNPGIILEWTPRTGWAYAHNAPIGDFPAEVLARLIIEI
jgi:hypothetical protein